MCSCEDSVYVSPNAPQLLSGSFLHYKAKFFGTNWEKVFAILYQDSTLEWYKERALEGSIFLKSSPELIASGQNTRCIFEIPDLGHGHRIDDVFAVADRRRRQIHFFIATNQPPLSSWMNAITSTLSVPTVWSSSGFNNQPPAVLPTAPPASVVTPQRAVVTQPITQPVLNRPMPPPPYYQYQQPITHGVPVQPVVVHQTGPSYGDVALGVAAGAVLGSTLSTLANPYHGGYVGYGGYGGGGFYEDNDVTIVNNYNVTGNINNDWSSYDNGGGGYDDAGFSFDF